MLFQPDISRQLARLLCSKPGRLSEIQGTLPFGRGFRSVLHYKSETPGASDTLCESAVLCPAPLPAPGTLAVSQAEISFG